MLPLSGYAASPSLGYRREGDDASAAGRPLRGVPHIERAGFMYCVIEGWFVK